MPTSTANAAADRINHPLMPQNIARVKAGFNKLPPDDTDTKPATGNMAAAS